MNVGVHRLTQDLSVIGFEGVRVQNNNGLDFAVIPNFEIPAGKFAGRIIDLAIPAPPDYPRSQGASIHIKSNPHLSPFEHVQNVKNVIASSLGTDWQYWSYNFNVRQTNSTNELISKINEIFKNFR